ncbi:MAG: hypothetical protein QOG86_1724 [Thermoleophilaceae bacterium]|nr:hypothetical protein [Thermoleophilaceae bacterium]
MSDHDGYLGPDSVAWKVVGHPVSLVGGLRALIVQSLHPLAMAGVAQHSDYRNRSLDRLRRTAYYVTATTFGDRATADAAARRVRSIHRKVRGIDPVTGRAYSADDPETQLWVHCVEWHSFLAAYRAYGGRLTADEQDRYHEEGARVAPLVGLPEAMVPRSVAEQREYFESVRSQLVLSRDARDAIRFVLSPPLTRDLLPFQIPVRLLARAALAIVPRDLRRLAQVDQPRALDAVTLAAVRPAAALLTLPLLRDAPSLVLGRGTRAVALAAREDLGAAA